jgi:flagellar secretion chaperone FliS
MYATAGYARKRYASVDVSSKVEGASPHQLIAVLYDEAMKGLDTLAAGMAANGVLTSEGIIQRRSRVNGILLGLEGSLDHQQGGELSQNLRAVYREARRLLGEGTAARDPKPVIRAREMIAEIATAWAQIG